MNDNAPLSSDDRLAIAWQLAFDLAFGSNIYRDEASRKMAEYLLHTVELIALDIGMMEHDITDRVTELQSLGLAPTFKKLVGRYER